MYLVRKLGFTNRTAVMEESKHRKNGPCCKAVLWISAPKQNFFRETWGSLYDLWPEQHQFA